MMKVLSIGNSFSEDAHKWLRKLAVMNGAQMETLNLCNSGCSLERHWKHIQNNSAAYTFQPNGIQPPWRIPVTLEGTLQLTNWDVITIQQHFSPERTADYETAKTSCEPYAKDLYDYLKKEYPNAKLYWQQTWAYQAGHAEIPDTAAQTKQQNIINKVSNEICQENGVNRIPSGDAWTIARANVGDTLCQTDMYHDGDIGGGQYLNACVWFEIITGQSVIGNSYVPAYKYPAISSSVTNKLHVTHDGTYYTFTTEFLEQMQTAAHKAVEDLKAAQ
jgi:hypothetical protein